VPSNMVLAGREGIGTPKPPRRVYIETSGGPRHEGLSRIGNIPQWQDRSGVHSRRRRRRRGWS